MDNKKLFELYTLTEMTYEKQFNNVDKSMLYPEGWYNNKNYKNKIEILGEAIKENKLIVNTKKYSESIECVKTLTINKKSHYWLIFLL